MAISATLEMTAKARDLKNKGKDIINLSVGEPDFETPDFIKEEAIRAIHQNYNSYSPVDGFLDLKEAVCFKFKRDNDIVYNSSQIVVSTGAKQSLANIALAMINPGDEVILPAPFWVSYSEIVKLAGGVPIIIKTNIDSDFKITAEQLSKAITPKTKMVWYSSPCNPSGSVYIEKELNEIANVLKKNKSIFVVSDEIYEHINFSSKHMSIAQIDGMYDNTITVNGLSKSFAMTGWRIGYIGAPEWIAKACNKVQGQTTSGANSIAQRAAIVALRADSKKLAYMVNAFKERRDVVLNLLREIKGFKINQPTGAFYIFPDISYYFEKTLKGTTIRNASEFAIFLLEYANVAVVTGEAFGNENCIRISYATSLEQLQKAIGNIKKALDS